MNQNDPFGFTPRWFELGLVNDVILTDLQTEWAKGEDDNPEHYRYRAFRDFFSLQQPLSAELAAALWDLADSDRDLRWSIRTEILRRPECPETLIELSLATGQKHLERIIEGKRGSK